MASLHRFASILLLAVTGSVATLTGCASRATPQAAAAKPANLDIRVTIAEGTIHGFDFGAGTAPINFSVAPDPAKSFLCGIISESDTAAARVALANDGNTVLSAPRIIAASGKAASIEVGDDLAGTMKLGVIADALPDGSLRVKLNYASGTAGPGFPETTFTLKPGQSIVAIARGNDPKPGGKGVSFQTLLITPGLAPALANVH